MVREYIFCTLIPKCYMFNLFSFVLIQIGLAVGDIESVQRNARLKRLAMQVGLNNSCQKATIVGTHRCIA